MLRGLNSDKKQKVKKAGFAAAGAAQRSFKTLVRGQGRPGSGLDPPGDPHGPAKGGFVFEAVKSGSKRVALFPLSFACIKRETDA